MRKTWFLFLLLPVLVLAGCADGNSDAPNTDQPHPLGAAWLLPSGHAAQAQADPDSCFGCHTLEESGSGAGPACLTCHVGGSPLVFTGCRSCHNPPPDSAAPTGDVRPNRQEGHAGHDAIAGISGNCAICHNGFGTGTVGHFDTEEPADVAVAQTYDAKTGTAAYDEEFMTCMEVSCHGGQESPDWTDETFRVEASCDSCHELGPDPLTPQTPQYNSYYSGQHAFHLGMFPSGCVLCHDTSKLETGHFSNLATPEFEQDPGDTLVDALNFDVQFSTCTTNIAACHGGDTRPW